MRTSPDFLAVLSRAAVGFDRMTNLMEAARLAADGPSYPPYNIEKTGQDTFEITLAVAGMAEKDIELTTEDNILRVVGRAEEPATERVFLHRGIAGRAFNRSFVLADHVRVEAAALEHGVLRIALRYEVPEALKSRRIEITGLRPANSAVPVSTPPVTEAAA